MEDLKRFWNLVKQIKIRNLTIYVFSTGLGLAFFIRVKMVKWLLAIC